MSGETRPPRPPSTTLRLRGDDVLKLPAVRGALLGRGGDASLVERVALPVGAHVGALDFLAAGRLDAVAAVAAPGSEVTTLAPLPAALRELWSVDLAGTRTLRDVSALAAYSVLGRVGLVGCTAVGFAEVAALAPVQILALEAPPLEGWHPLDRRALLVRLLPRCWCIDGVFVTARERQAAAAFFASEPGQRTDIFVANRRAVAATDGAVGGDSATAGGGATGGAAARPNVATIHSYRALEVKRDFAREPVNSKFADKRRLKFLARQYHRDLAFEVMQVALDARGALAAYDEDNGGRSGGGGGGGADFDGDDDADDSSALAADPERHRLIETVVFAETEAAQCLVPDDDPTNDTPFDPSWAPSLLVETRLQMLILLSTSQRYAVSSPLLSEVVHSLLATADDGGGGGRGEGADGDGETGGGGSGGRGADVDPESLHRIASFIGGYPAYMRKALLMTIHESVERERNLGQLRQVEVVLWRALRLEEEDMGDEEVRVLATLALKLFSRLQFDHRQGALLREAEALLDIVEDDLARVAPHRGASTATTGAPPVSRLDRTDAQVRIDAKNKGGAREAGEAAGGGDGGGVGGGGAGDDEDDTAAAALVLRVRSITPHSRQAGGSQDRPLPMDAADKAGLRGRRRLTKREALAARGDRSSPQRHRRHQHQQQQQHQQLQQRHGRHHNRGNAATAAAMSMPQPGESVDAGNGCWLTVESVDPAQRMLAVDIGPRGDPDGALRVALAELSPQLHAQLMENDPSAATGTETLAATGPRARRKQQEQLDRARASNVMKRVAHVNDPAHLVVGPGLSVAHTHRVTLPLSFLLHANGHWHLVPRDDGNALRGGGEAGGTGLPGGGGGGVGGMGGGGGAHGGKPSTPSLFALSTAWKPYFILAPAPLVQTVNALRGGGWAPVSLAAMPGTASVGTLYFFFLRLVCWF
jgi:hypothetical protein